MKEVNADGRGKPRSIYQSFFGSGVLMVVVIAVVCLVVVLVCHLFETPTLEANVLRDTPVAGCLIPNAFEMMSPLAA